MEWAKPEVGLKATGSRRYRKLVMRGPSTPPPVATSARLGDAVC